MARSNSSPIQMFVSSSTVRQHTAKQKNQPACKVTITWRECLSIRFVVERAQKISWLTHQIVPTYLRTVPWLWAVSIDLYLVCPSLNENNKTTRHTDRELSFWKHWRFFSLTHASFLDDVQAQTLDTHRTKSQNSGMY